MGVGLMVLTQGEGKARMEGSVWRHRFAHFLDFSHFSNRHPKSKCVPVNCVLSFVVLVLGFRVQTLSPYWLACTVQTLGPHWLGFRV